MFGQDSHIKIEQEIIISDVGNLEEIGLVDNYIKKNLRLLFFISKSEKTTITINEQLYMLANNQAIIYPLVEIFDIENLSGEGIFIILSGQLINNYISLEKLKTVLNFKISDPIITKINEINTTFTLKKNTNTIKLIELGFGLLLSIYSHKPNSNPLLPKPVSDAILIIEKEYNYIYSVEDLADKVGVNKSHLIRIFKTHLNITTGKYLEKYRIQKAKEYLCSGGFNIDMVAKLCGYSCANYFGKVFKKTTGVSPSQYIKTIQFKTKINIPKDIYL